MTARPPLLALREAQFGFGRAPLFEGISVSLGAGDRICLVGRNGCGKSTLLQLLTGALEIDSGDRFVQPGCRIAHLAQEPVFRPDATVAELIEDVAPARHRVDAMLAHYGLDGEAPADGLSGGESRRLALARAFVMAPDILLLDEPTNHLDLPAIEQLEKDIATLGGAVLIVSHDRAFLTNLSRSTLWLERGRLRRHNEGFASFEAWAERVAAAEAHTLSRLDKKLAAEARWLHRGITARRRRNQGRLRRLGEMRATRAALLGAPHVERLRPSAAEIKSRLVVEAESITKVFNGPKGERTVLDGFSTRILRGDRVGIIGPNGGGKTTLLRLLTGDLAPDSGKVRRAKALRPAYFDQLRARLDTTATVIRTLCPEGGDTVFVQGRPRHVVGYLKGFLFTPDQVKGRVGALSGGERNRLLLAKVLAEPGDLLALDEPTNDLDMDTLDLLEDMLGEYAGTLLVVSHDRDFLDRIVTSTIALEGHGRAREYAGGYADYLTQRRQSGTTADRPRRVRPERADGSTARPRPIPDRLTYRDQRELDRLPSRIETLTAEIAALEAQLADSTLYGRDPDAYRSAAGRLATARPELLAAEARWLDLETRREALTMARSIGARR